MITSIARKVSETGAGTGRRGFDAAGAAQVASGSKGV